MRQAALTLSFALLLASCAQGPPLSRDPSDSTPQHYTNGATGALTDTLLALSREWVDTWNQKNVARMAQLHGDSRNTLYGIGNAFTTVEWLLQELREKNFWGVSWKLAMEEPHVRILGSTAGLVSFRLVGEETGAAGTKPFVAAFTLVYQKLGGVWKIVHVQDSSRLDEPASR